MTNILLYLKQKSGQEYFFSLICCKVELKKKKSEIDHDHSHIPIDQLPVHAFP